MKRIFPMLLFALSVIISACTAQPTAMPDSTATLAPVVSTALPDTPEVIIVTPPPVIPTVDSGSPNSDSSTVMLSDNRKIIKLHVGDSFLLNLGSTYDWSFSIDDQSVVSLRMGVLVIQGAQGIFEAHAPGTATLTASGDPQCRKSTPPCMMPSIMFEITIVVQ